jgi:hypothetical protein
LNSLQKENKIFKLFRIKKFKIVETIIEEGQKGIFRKDVIIPLITPTILGTFSFSHEQTLL